MHGLKPRRGDVAAPSTRLSGVSRSGQAALETFIVVLVVNFADNLLKHVFKRHQS